MRIIAGKHRSRKIKSVDSTLTRSTLDQVKESIFQRMGPYFDGGTFLDLFAGSGNIGLEALSRGVESVTFVDNQRKAIETINKNVKALKEEESSHIIKAPYQKAISLLNEKKTTFDWIYLDPPYNFKDYEKLLEDVVPLLKKAGQVLLECKTEVRLVEQLELIDKYQYRTTAIYHYQKGSS